MERTCPVCQSHMKKVASGMELPSLPFIKIPEWIKEAHAYECKACGYIGLWHEPDEEDKQKAATF